MHLRKFKHLISSSPFFQFSPEHLSGSGNHKNLNIGIISQNEQNIFGAQAYFSTAQKLLSSSSDPKKQTCCISKYIFFKNKHIVLPKNVGGTQSNFWRLQA